MRIMVVAVILAVGPAVVRAQPPSSDSDPRVVKGKWQWHAALPGTVPRHDHPEEACQDWAKDAKKRGQPHKFIKVKPGTATSNEDKTCVYVDEQTKKEWDQANGASSEYICPEGTHVISLGNQGTAASERCQCNDDKACPAKASTAPDAPPPPAT